MLTGHGPQDHAPWPIVSADLAAIGMTVGPSASYWWRSGYLAPLTLLGSFAVFVIALAARQLLGLQGGLIRTLLCAVLGLAVGGSLLGPDSAHRDNAGRDGIPGDTRLQRPGDGRPGAIGARRPARPPFDALCGPRRCGHRSRCVQWPIRRSSVPLSGAVRQRCAPRNHSANWGAVSGSAFRESGTVTGPGSWGQITSIRRGSLTSPVSRLQGRSRRRPPTRNPSKAC